MKEQIVSRLHEIERREQVRILLAVESGSRAWGFASPDSDYDVRFIYIRPQKDYLRLERVRDVIEEPIAGELDINGWDLQKALRLLHKSNPTLFEWVSSPIVYLETDFADRFRAVMQPYFSSKSALYHYLCTAQGNYREYLRGDRVRAKKYFYVLRPILACRWVLERGTPPPMRFDELAAAELPQALRADVAYLLDLKIHAPEVKEIPKITALNDYLEAAMPEVRALVAALPPQPPRTWQELNEFFFAELRE